MEYSRTGELIKGHDKPKVRSRYDEDGRSPVFRLSHVAYSQSCSTTTRQSGDRGTTAKPVNGVSHAATLSVSLVGQYHGTELTRQYPDPTVLVKQVLPQPQHPPQTPSWNHAKSTTVYKPLPKPKEQPQKQKSSDRVNVKKQSDGQNHKKAKRLNLIKPDSRRLSRRRRREIICLKRNLWLGPRNPSRMFRKRKWVSGLQVSQFQCLADFGRGLSDVEAGLRRSHGELQGRGGLVYGLVTIQLDLVVVLASCVPSSYAFQSFTF